jgi:ariadne-1
VHDEWFADEERVRKVVGLPEKHIEMPNDREVFPCFISFTCSSSCLSMFALEIESQLLIRIYNPSI